MIGCALGVGAVSTDLILSGLAARGARAEKNINSIPTANTKPRPINMRGPLASSAACSAPFTALQGCVVNCNATVPATGTVGVAVSFQSSATATGCSTQPTFSWDFGDGGISSQQNPSRSYVAAGTYTWTLNSSASSGGLTLDTVAGGLGEGAPTLQSPFGTIGAIARDPMGRGVYVSDATDNGTLIRFINTSASPVTLGVRTIAPGTVRAIAGGGGDFTTDNISAFQADVGSVSGLAVSPDGNLVYYNDKGGGTVRAVNVSTGAVNVRGASTGAGNVRTLASSSDFPQQQFPELFGLTTNPTNGDVFVIDSIVNKVYRITSNGTVNLFAGNGAMTVANDPFTPGSATGIPLLQPRAVKSDSTGNIFIADTGHRRVIRVSGGSATLIRQFDLLGSVGNPFPVGIAIVGGNVYVLNGNEQALYRANNNGPKLAGILISGDPASCDYSSNNCGDGGATINAGFNLLGSSDDPPLAGLEGDNEGLYIADQKGKGRVRFVNLVGGTVTRAGVQIATNTINTIAGSGRTSPFDGGLAAGATFGSPTGVAVDGNGNMWVADTNDDRLRFVNQGANPVTIFNGTPSAQNVPAGAIVTVNRNFGTGSGDDLPVIQASFDKPQGLFVTSQGVYVVDSLGGPRFPATIDGEDSSQLRFINTTGSPITFYPGSAGGAITVPPGNIGTIAGTCSSCVPNGSTSGFATNVTLKGSSDVAVASNGTIYITDVRNRAVRRIDASTGIVSALNLPSAKEYTGLGFTSDARLLVANFTDGTVHRESAAGSGTFGLFGGTGGNLQFVRDVVGGPGGNVFATIGPATPSSGNHRIVQILSTGSTAVISGGLPGFDGDGGAASAGRLNTSPPRLVLKSIPPNVTVPETVNIALGQNGEIIFTDTNNNRVRQISGAISTCSRTGTITISGPNPIPVLTSIDPTSRQTGSGAFILRAIGDKFAPNSAVRLDNVVQPTTFQSATELTASIPASALQTGGMARSVQVTVLTPASASGGGGGSSGAVTFTITGNNPVPSITSLEPPEKREGDVAFSLAVNGSGFINGASLVRYGGTPRITTFVNPNRLTAQITADDLIGVGPVDITVFNPAPQGGESNKLTFTVRPGTADPPVLTSISPNSITAGSAAFALVATGSKFTSNSKVVWTRSGTPTDLMTAFGSETQLTAQVPAALVATQGTAQVTVVTPAPGGGTSAPQTFTINSGGTNPTPAVTVLNPTAVGVSHGAFNLIVNGSNFVGSSQAQVNVSGSFANRVTTSISATRLSVAVLAGDIPATAGTVQVRVINPAPGGGTSNTVTLNVMPRFTTVSAASFFPNPAPQTADSIAAGFGVGLASSTGFAVTNPLPTDINGTQVRVTDSGGTERQAGLFFVTAGQLNYHMPPGTAIGVATAVVSRNGTIVAAGPVNITSLAPGLFTFPGTGAGIVAGVALRVQGATQTFDQIFDIQGGGFVPRPINMGPSTDIVYLIVFGTGMRGNSGPAGITVDFGNGMTKTLRADFSEGAFATPGTIALDQCNIFLPRTLIGAGLLNMKLTIDGRTTNTVQFSIQ
ncbi:MAG TPA: PKD domain-containing protein [Blastocatellia bacterium]|nr:PKD domain-containing protein [Blastocatellia bacterium]